MQLSGGEFCLSLGLHFNVFVLDDKFRIESLFLILMNSEENVEEVLKMLLFHFSVGLLVVSVVAVMLR